MDDEQPELDFEGRLLETRVRYQWARNARRDRAFWTRERLCLSWMQGTTPDDSDMRWWRAQPAHRRAYWQNLHRMAKEEAARRRMPVTPFHLFEAMILEAGRIRAEEDESLINRFLAWIREDFKAGRPCSIDLSNCSPGQRHRSQACLDEAIRRAGIPPDCLR